MRLRGAVLTVVYAGAALAQVQAQVQLTKIAGGFDHPTYITGAGDGSGRLFVVEQGGTIRIIKDGKVLSTPFLDINTRVACCGERGLLSMAFPPGYPTKSHFYVYYNSLAGDVTISRFGLGASPDVADPSSETVILQISHRQYENHNGGQLVFGPDGFLYIGTGDGGGGGDPLGNAQNTNSLLGKLLRIDVEGGAQTYSIPSGNPFANQSGHKGEIWAYGLRNPWRFSFDPAGDIYIADVGQEQYEEVNVQPVAAGGGQNYGWNRTEGMHCYQAGCSTAGITMPVVEYSHAGNGCSISGGYVYRGTRYPALRGTYYYGDFCTGKVWALKYTGGAWQNTLALTSGLRITTFGQDDTGELYLADSAKGDIYHIVGTAAAVEVQAVVSGASFEPGIAPGGLASLFGLGITNTAGILYPSGSPLPTTLDGISVLVAGTPAPVLAIARVNGIEQINFQVPFESLPGPHVEIAVKNGATQSAAFDAEITSEAPALFTFDGGAHVAAQHADFRPVRSNDAVSAGEAIILYATGLGAVTNEPASGSPSPLDPLAITPKPTVTIGGKSATVEFSGLSPFLVGVYQVNVRIPSGLAAGDQDVVVATGGHTAKAIPIPVK